ncbi:1,4-alpha-glucan branching enzyme [Mangrovactinospora gilvigrisea]|uniref:1,4-alpha-glucan branching enzyme GlgB n=1 Tax=Mangrovactinospora gilvigrisea TaxID=1428644 RepID=A0A1J7C6R1_9ACTN|nr:1,4-alpha-glucan branching enzyme [Mangrovactinospora gilvigrisea]
MGPAPLDPEELDRLRHGAHHDPHALLGVHPLPDDHLAIRSWRPFAQQVTVDTPIGRARLHDHGDGLFTGVLPLATLPDHSLLVTYGGEERKADDPWAFLPTLGPLDLHLIAEGRHEQLWHALGARAMDIETSHGPVAGTAFAVWAPNARGVRLVGDHNAWSQGREGTGLPMRSLGASGVWEVFAPGVGPGDRYKYEILGADGAYRLKADPMARRTQPPPDTASVVADPDGGHPWGDDAWMASRGRERPHHRAPLSVYEVHLPSWRPELTSYRAIADVLPDYVADLGFTHLELLPVAEHPFGGSWGYQVTSYYAPTARLGPPEDFKHLVDACHRRGLGVIMDWVPAHFPKDDWALARFDGGPLYEHPDPRLGEHPDWGTLTFDFGRTEVRNFLVANAVYWCEEFHIDGLRVDAVASMLYRDYSREGLDWLPNAAGGRENWEAVSLLQEANATVYRRCPGVMTIAEESTAWPGVSKPTEQNGLGFGFKWNMGWMHDSLEYMQHEPVHRRYHHNDMTFSMIYAYSENYILPISHDEVVHGKRSLVAKMPGDWWQQRANLRAYLAYMWAHPGKQLLFMGQEFAQGSEWSHDDGPQWWLLDEGYPAREDHAGVLRLVRDLNRIYRGTPALWEQDADPDGFSWLPGTSADDNVLAFVRRDAGGGMLACAANLSPVVRHGYPLTLPDAPGWDVVLNTDAAVYGGSDVDPSPRPAALTLPPLAAVWLTPT